MEGDVGGYDWKYMKGGEEIFWIAQLKAWTWLRNKISKANFPYSNWCLCPKSCI